MNTLTLQDQPVAHPTWALLRESPAHWIAFFGGAGLVRKAPGTAGTLWAWASFLVLQKLGFTEAHWALLIGVSLPLGWWACTATARRMAVQDPGSIVFDEVVAFWLVLWLAMPTGFWGQLIAFGLFRYFDAVKPGPVGWADQLFHSVNVQLDPRGWSKAGFGILLDDLVAAGCTLLVIAFWRFI